MPIISSHPWNADGFRTTLDEHMGETVKKDNNEQDPLVVGNDVYFMNMRIDNTLLVPHVPKPEGLRPPKDVREAGAP